MKEWSSTERGEADSNRCQVRSPVIRASQFPISTRGIEEGDE